MEGRIRDEEEEDKIVGDTKEIADNANGNHWLFFQRDTVPKRMRHRSKDRSKETPRGVQRFYDTEKSYNEEERTSAYEQPKHHE